MKAVQFSLYVSFRHSAAHPTATIRYLETLCEQTHGAGTQYVRRTLRCSTYNTKYHLTTRINERLQACGGRHVVRETSLTSNRNPLIRMEGDTHDRQRQN